MNAEAKWIISQLENAFLENASSERAGAMSAYMKHKFKFYGIPAKTRDALIKEVNLSNTYKSEDELLFLVNEMWKREQREWQYAAIIILAKYKKMWSKKTGETIQSLIIRKSWWDSVDGISSNIVSPFFLKFPELKANFLRQWERNDNIWMQRVCIIHQLTYRVNTDIAYLEKLILNNMQSKEFFIQKAIGWALRQYAKTDSKWVIQFVESHKLKPLSIREALKNIK